MKSKKLMVISFLILVVFLLSACEMILPTSVSEGLDSAETDINETEEIAPPPATESTDIEDPSPTQEPETPTPEATQAPTSDAPEEGAADSPSEEAGEDPEQTPAPEIPVVVGPDDYPDDFNPLTGLPAEDPALLPLPPALISISNFPASARPQAGLNSSPITFEIAIGEGMTRFLAMFYGGYPEAISGQTEGEPPSEGSESGSTGDESQDGESDEPENSAETASIGPIRSGRLPYEDIRSLYTGFLVMASAWEGVAQDLSDTTSVYGDDSEDINSALVGVDKLKQIAQTQAEGYPGANFNLTGMKFAQTPPKGGQTAHQVWVFYSMLNQVQWRYEAELGAYIRYDIKTDGSGEFVMATDRLTGEPVSKENLIVIYAEHDYRAPTLIDINFTNRPPTKALLFRDGEIHEIFWTTQFGEYEKETGLLRPIRFVDAEGNPIPLKPGQTWIHVVSLSSYHRESAISDQPFHPVIEQPGTGLWLVRYKGKY